MGVNTLLIVVLGVLLWDRFCLYLRRLPKREDGTFQGWFGDRWTAIIGWSLGLVLNLGLLVYVCCRMWPY